MLKVNKVHYEIWDAKTHDVLVDNLTFDEAAEQCKVYEDFFGAEVIVVVVDYAKIISAPSVSQQYKSAYIDYMDILCNIGNL